MGNVRYNQRIFETDSLMKICYDFIGAVGKLKISYTFFISSIFLKYRRFHVEFTIIRCSAVGFFLLSHKTVN
jgi:hypothetical protein